MTSDTRHDMGAAMLATMMRHDVGSIEVFSPILAVAVGEGSADYEGKEEFCFFF